MLNINVLFKKLLIQNHKIKLYSYYKNFLDRIQTNDKFMARNTDLWKCENFKC